MKPSRNIMGCLIGIIVIFIFAVGCSGSPSESVSNNNPTNQAIENNLNVEVNGEILKMAIYPVGTSSET